jgi:undecaprenyl-diphosphatase UppP
MTFFQSLILGIVQGLTEYLPVSSSAHLVLVPYLFNWTFPTSQIFPFDVLVQLGTLVAVILYFWKDIVSILKSFFKGLIDKEPFKDPQARLGWYLILATIPAGIAGVLIKSQVEAAFSSPRLTAFFLFGTAALLILADLIGKRTRQMEDLTWWDALWIGLFQAISIFPGISRSGATITGGMTRNFDRSTSARFSFLMSIPVMLGAGLVSLKDLAAVPDLGSFLPVLLVGFIAALIIGYLSIHWLLAFLRRQRLWYFAAYCVVLAGVVLTVADLRALPAQAAAPTGSATANAAVSTISPTLNAPGLQVINLEYSNSLNWLTPAMSSCANLLQNTGLVTHSLPTDSLDLKKADLFLRWGAPAQLTQTTYQIGSERLALVVNAKNSLHSLTPEVARQVFSGAISTWGDLHKTCPDCFTNAYDSSFDSKSIALNFYPTEMDVEQIFVQQVMAGQPVAAGAGLLTPDPEAMRESVSNSPQAIGFLPAHLLDANLSEVSLTGIDPKALNQPILLFVNAEPQGKTLEWLNCLEQVSKP